MRLTLLKQDPMGSGMDFVLKDGLKVTSARRCCTNCRCIVGTWPGEWYDGTPLEIVFIPGELTAEDDEARALLASAG